MSTSELPESTVAVTAIVPVFNRSLKCIKTLNRIYSCVPRPKEVIVHVDGNQELCASEIRNAFPEIKILYSIDRIGPGGSRNRLIEAASCPLVASFDDDSYPVDQDYFGKVVEVCKALSDASIVDAELYHPGEQITAPTDEILRVADFAGGACIYRREKFQEIGGYLPIVIPYGIEEVDLALRCCAHRAPIYHAGCLRVFHDNDRSEQAGKTVTAASIINIALLAFLRYPVACWPVGVGQVINRLIWLVRMGRISGIVHGLAGTPGELLMRRKDRKPVSMSAVVTYLQLRRSSGAKQI